MLESIPKPCLKPQSSYSSSDESNASSYELSSEPYRKSVSFADAIGGDLCHIRTFAKGINDAFMFEDDWWKDCALNPWNDDEEDEEDIEDLDLLDYCTDYYGYIDEEADENGSESDEDNELYLPLYVSSPPSKESTPISFAQEIQSEESEVVRTFVAPGDLPEFDQILRERLFCVEDVNLTTMSGGGLRISGSLQLRESSSEPIPLTLPLSIDGWDSLHHMETFSIPGGGRGEEECGDAVTQHAFQIEARHLDLRVGDDLELQICATFGEVTQTDDNASHNYRFICKKKAKFQPGRSLW